MQRVVLCYLVNEISLHFIILSQIYQRIFLLMKEKQQKQAINTIMFFHSAHLENFELLVSMGDIERKF